MDRDDFYRMETLFPTVIHKNVINYIGSKLETVVA